MHHSAQKYENTKDIAGGRVGTTPDIKVVWEMVNPAGVE